MEALLLTRAGTTTQPIKEGLKNEGVRLHEVMWTPMLNIEEHVWGLKTICVYLDHDKKLLLSAQAIKKVYPRSTIFLLEDEFSEQTSLACKDGLGFHLHGKPWDTSKIARLMKTSLLDESASMNDEPQTVSRISFDSETRCVRCAKMVVPLRNKEYALLEFLFLNRGKLITRNNLIEHVWDRNSKIASNTLDVHIGRLRKKLEQPFKLKLIHTVHSVGYRFDCNV